LAPSYPVDDGPDLFVEGPAIEQVGQRIMVGEVLDLGLGPFALGDVVEGRDEAAIGRNPLRDGDDPAVAEALQGGASCAATHEFALLLEQLLEIEVRSFAALEGNRHDLPQGSPRLELLRLEAVDF